jgi:hypothetical protein
MDQFFFKRLGRTHGPFSKEDLNKFWLFPGTLVRKSDTEHWTALSETGELNDMLPLSRRRQNIVFIISSILVSVIVAGIIIFLNIQISTEVIEQNIKCKNDISVSFPSSSVNNTDTLLKAVSNETFTDNARMQPLPVSTIKIKSEPAEKIYLKKLEALKSEVRNHFNDYIKNNNSSFRTDENGVNDVNVVVSNGTVFMLDDMQVNVQYMDAKGTIIDILPVYFRNLKPLCVVNQMAPLNSRARSVSFIIISAHSKSLNFCFPSPAKNVSSKDPFYCK